MRMGVLPENAIRAEIATSNGGWTFVNTANMGMSVWNREGLGVTAARFEM